MAQSIYDKLITFNTYKQAPTIVNLTSLFNGRVGDQGLRLATRWLQGEAMKSFIAAVTQEFRAINRNNTTQDTQGVSIGTKQENHFANPNTKPKTYTAEQMAKIADYTNGEDVTW